MHVPDGFINAPVSVAAGVAAAGAVALSLRGARRELSGAGPGGRNPGDTGLGAGGERTAPLAGLVAAFIFAVQMLNFPVAAGTSGHLLGGALAAILVGPYTGVLCIAVVLLMQGVLFADGGLTALGVNITIMGVVTVVVAYGLFRGLLAVLPRGRRTVTAAAFVAALVSVPASAASFTLLYAIGGTTDVPIGKVLTAMVGVHVLIGIGEAAITMLTVGAVIAVRPDLVYGARGLAQPLKLRVGGELVDAAPAPVPASAAASPSPSPRKVWLAGLAAALVLAGFVSFYASASPDGLEKVAADKGIDAKVEEHAAADSPLADYGIEDVSNARISGGLAGVIGVTATVAVGSGVFYVVVRRRRTTESDGGSSSGAGVSSGAGSGSGASSGSGAGSGSAGVPNGTV
ncbi:energy-coupling factor ABC transporter permease [Streptomyces sp. NPDC004838]